MTFNLKSYNTNKYDSVERQETLKKNQDNYMNSWLS